MCKYFTAGAVLLVAMSSAGADTAPPWLPNSGMTLAETAQRNNVTVDAIVKAGMLLCGEHVNADGVLTGSRVVAIIGRDQTPVTVAGQYGQDVRTSCPIGLVPGAMPPNADPNTIVMVQAAATKLPHVAQ